MILLGDAAEVLKDFNDNCIDLTVTSPPYDNLRFYKGNSEFNFEEIAKQLFRITKIGGVVIWVVGDATVNHNESGTSFKQALHFKKIGFKLNDTMILQTKGFSIPSSKAMGRYHQVFQYIFVLSKEYVKTFNPLIDRKNKKFGQINIRKKRTNKDQLKHWSSKMIVSEYGMRFNVWLTNTGSSHTSDDGIIHPAMMVEDVARDLILSWSNEGDLILDPFAGSGTTLKAAHQLNRKWIGIEINPDYVQLAKKRLTPYVQQQRLETP